jgi:hypothetical protein
VARKTVYLLNIDNYAPEVTALTYPTINAWAAKIEANVHVIANRRFPKWPITYEKLQIHQLAKARGDDWSIYIDSDALIHPDLPDVTELIRCDFVCHNAVDFAPIRFRYDDYFRRHGQNIGSANWFCVASSWCRDLWRPLDDLTPEEAVRNITLSQAERRWMKPEHLVDDYALSRNIARFGLKVVTLTQIWAEAKLPYSEFFYHQYQMSLDDYEGPLLDPFGNQQVDDDGQVIVGMLPGKVNSMKLKLEAWGI